MQIYADYHTHTNYSHGRDDMASMVQAAIIKGLTRIAFSEHSMAHVTYGVRKKNLYAMRYEVDKLKQRYQGRIDILLGLEANLIGIDGKLDVDDDMLAQLDVLLMGFHRMVKPASWQSAWRLPMRNLLFKKGNCKTIAQNTKAYMSAMKRYPIDIVAHPGAYIPLDMEALSAVAAEHGIALEINSAHGFCAHDDVIIGKKAGACFVIGSDAHSAERVGDFTQAIQIAKKAGIDERDILNARMDGKLRRERT